MTPAALAEGVAGLLAEQGGGPVLGWAPTLQGMNSVTVQLDLPTGARIAKWVPESGAVGLRSGALVAEELAVAGIRSGPPRRWGTGDVIHALGDGAVALLVVVDGAPLSAEASDRDDWGRALGRLHRLLARTPGPMEHFLAAVGLVEPLPPLARWVRDALVQVTGEVETLGRLRWVQLHTDPTPDAFVRGAEGDVGTIDWSGSVPGPALYDVASAEMYAGGPARARRLVERYYEAVDVSVTSEREALRVFRRLRAVVQAVYFSRRLAASDLTGVDSQRDNERGLADARRILEGERA